MQFLIVYSCVRSHSTHSYLCLTLRRKEETQDSGPGAIYTLGEIVVANLRGVIANASLACNVGTGGLKDVVGRDCVIVCIKLHKAFC